MEDSSVINRSFINKNLNNYEKIFDVSTLNSENDSQYYTNSDQFNHSINSLSSNKRNKYLTRNDSNEDWNKRISNSRINQFTDSEEPSSLYNDSSTLKHYNDSNSYNYKEPYMYNDKIEMNTTENKKESNKRDKTDKLVQDQRRKSHSKKKSRKTSKDLKKRDDSDVKSSKRKEKERYKRQYKNDDQLIEESSIDDNLKDIYKYLNSVEIKNDSNNSLNSTLNSSDTSINKIIQKNLSEYSKDITNIINRDDEYYRRKESDNISNGSTEKNKPLISNDINEKLKQLIDENDSDMNYDIFQNDNDSEINNKISYIDKLMNEFNEKRDQPVPSKSNSSSNKNKTNKNQIPPENMKNNKKWTNEEDLIVIKCPFYSNGCTWCNQQSKLSDHLLYECTFCPTIINNNFVNSNSKSKNKDNKNKEYKSKDSKNKENKTKENKNKNRSIEKLNEELNKLSIRNNDKEKLMSKNNDSKEYDKDVLNHIFNNYVNQEEQQQEKIRPNHDLHEGLFDQIIQDYKYSNDNINNNNNNINNNNNRNNRNNNNNNNNNSSSNENHKNKNNEKKLTLDTNIYFNNKEDLIKTADINFNNEPLTWDINSEKDNEVPWIETPVSSKIKERKKYNLSENNDKVSIKNKKSPDKEKYSGKKLLNKYDNLISSIENPSTDNINISNSENEEWDQYSNDYNNKINKNNNTNNTDHNNNINNNSMIKNNNNNITNNITTTTTTTNNNNNSNVFDPNKPFKFGIPNDSRYYIPLAPPAPSEPLKQNEHKNLNDITLCVNTQLNNNNKDIYSMFTPQEIEVLMDIWFKNEDKTNPDKELIFNKSETSFIKDLLSTFDEETKNNLKEYNHHKIEESNGNLNNIDKLLSTKKNYNVSTNTLTNSTLSKFDINFSNEFLFKFNCEKWNKSKEMTYVPTITKELNQAFNVPKVNEKKTYSKYEVRKNEFKYMILCWIIKLFKNNTIYSICWKLINNIRNWINYIKSKLQKNKHSSKQKDKNLSEEEKIEHNHSKQNQKKNISEYINNAISKNDADNNLLMKWSPGKTKLHEILKRKKKFNKTQALYYRINQHEMKHNQDKHTLYTNFLDYQNARGFKSLIIQNNIRKKIKMMQTINDLKRMKTKSVVSPLNGYKKRKVEMEKKERSSITSFFNSTLNLFNTLVMNSKSKNQIVNGASAAKKNMNIFGAEANIDFNNHALIIFNKKRSELNYIPKNKDNILKSSFKLNEIDQLIIYNNDESGWMNILTSKPISNNMDLFYYEVKVGSTKPNKKYSYSWSVGFSTPKVQLSKYPDRLYSWDFYNTGVINKNNLLEKYGETFSIHDVIGCGIDFKNNLAFFTKNGKFLGIAIKNFLTEDLELYPNIGLFNNAKVETNFGAKKFMYKIEGYFYNKRLE